jgi:hypothetical protein
LKFGENRWNWAGPISKTAEITVHCFKISKKKIKVSKKYVKKVDQILSENRWNWAGPISKTAEFTVHCFKISKKDKSQQKICKKSRSNSKVTSEEIFVKPSRLDW